MKTIDIGRRIELKNILFLTDFSSASENASRYAFTLTRAYGSRLIALYVRPAVINPMSPPSSWRGLEEAARIEDDQHRNQLQRLFSGLNSKVVIVEGDFWSTVSTMVRDEQIDLIIMGTRGRSAVARLVLGSTAEETFRNASCPVLTVGVKAQTDAACGFTRILFATDLTSEGNAAVRYAVSLSQEFQSYLTLMHVVGETQPDDQVQAQDVVAADEDLLKKLLPSESESWFVPDFLIERGNVAERILSIANRRKAELIVLGVRKATGIHGAATHLPIAVVHEVVSKASCPVLTVPI